MKILCLLILLICLISAIAAGLHRRILPRPTSHPSKTERPDRTRATTVPISRGSRTEPTTVIPLSRSKRSGGSGPDKTDLLSNIEGVLEHLRKIVHHLKTSSDEKPHTLTAKIPARSFKEVNRAKRSNENDYITAFKQNLLNQLQRGNEENLQRLKLEIISNMS